jgi:hypothetical protein
MPTGPKGQKRPADVIGNAVRVMRIRGGAHGRIRPWSPVARAAAVQLADHGSQTRGGSLPDRYCAGWEPV